MNKYYEAFLETISKGSLERRTIIADGEEAIYQNGQLIASTSGNDISNPDLVEIIKAEPHLMLFGSGHVGKALYDLGVLQNMKMTVLDDREELLTEKRFPKAERFIAPFNELLKKEYDVVTPAYIIFTHGHSFDTDCLRYALSHPSSYIGMIGSKAKSAKALAEMREEGFSEEALRNVHTPIGLPIGAETPEEIAISIMAEIISVFRSGEHFSTIDPKLLKTMATNEGIAVRIIEKKGSAPRAVGSTMFVTENEAVGTIGGGAIEKEAIEEAKKMLKTEITHQTKHYDLSSSGDIGMVCGGNETLLFTLVK